MITLDTKDKELIDIWRKENTPNDQGEWCDIDTLLQPWKSAKSQYLYKLLGEETQIRKSISYSLSSDALKDKLEIMFRNSDFFYNYRAWYKKYHNPMVRFDPTIASPDSLGWDLITESEKDFVDLCYLITAENLYTNTCEAIIRKPITVKKPDGHKFKIFPESKLMRILAKIASAFNIEGFEEFRIAHSNIMAEAIKTGTLVLSIHPLDFMTMSNNNNDWSSCMRWDYDDPGDYCQGVVEMMNSPCVIEAYIESSSNSLTLGSNFEWNSKRWRELFIVTPEVIAAIKGYPEWDKNFEKEVLNWIKELAETNLGWSYSDSSISWAPDDNNNIHFHTNHMYNDFCYHHILFVAKDYEEISIDYSGVSECMVCGKTEPNVDDMDLACPDCYPVHYCCNCGERIMGDEYHIIDNEIYCSYCSEDANYCESCNSLTFADCTLVELFDEELDQSIAEAYLCDDCIDYYFVDLNMDKPYVVSNLTKKGEKYFL